MKPTERVDFSKFGVKFQENLAKLIMINRTFADQIGEVFETSYFETRYLQEFTNLIYAYKEKYKVHPTLETMASIIQVEAEDLDDITKKRIRDFLVRIYSNPELDGEDFIKDTALDFCKKQKLKEAILKSVSLLKKSSFDEIAKLINDALKLGQTNDFGYDYIKDFEERFLITSRNPVSTGWKEFDDIMGGGLGKGELGVALAGTGAGKSHILVHLGSQALKAGKTVIHYTLELSDTVIARRYDSCLTQTPLGDLNDFKDQILENIQEIEGALIVKEYPTKSITINNINNHLEKLKIKGITPDVIIVDYADLISAKKSYSEKRHDLESIYEELRKTAQIHECPIWTVSQTNRQGYNAQLVTIESISEAFSKCFVSDFIFTLSRTIEDKANNGGRFFVAKNRFGMDGIPMEIHMDTSKVLIKILKNQPTAGTLSQTPAKDQEQLLKDKYKQLMKGDK